MEQSRKRKQESQICVCVKGQDGVRVFFNVLRTARMLKLLQSYCKKRNLDYNTMQFLYNGQRFSVKQTIDQLGMENNDEIEAMMHQSGGRTVATETAMQ